MNYGNTILFENQEFVPGVFMQLYTYNCIKKVN